MDRKLNSKNLAQKLFQRTTSKQVLKDSIKEILFDSKDKKSIKLILAISFILTLGIVFSSTTIELLIEVIEMFNAVLLAIFAVVFTGYAFYQALISEELLKRLLTIEEEGKSYYQISNDYFINIMVLNVFEIFINVILIIFLKTLPKDFLLFDSMVFNQGLAFLLIIYYLYIELKFIYEMKSFLFNVYQLFNIAAGEMAIKIINNEKDSNSENKSEE